MSRFPLLLAVVAVVAGCDTAPGADEAIGDPVSITGFSLTPLSDSLETNAAVAEIPLTLQATTGGGGAARLLYTVRYRATDSLVTQGEMTGNGGQYNATPTLRLPRGAVGEYAVTVASEGADGSAGDRASSLFLFDATNLGAPEVASVDAPSSVSRGSDFSISAPMVDPDGRENIARVALLSEEGVLGLLRDDGQSQSGDATAGDGTFTIALSVPSEAEAGSIPLGVFAIDRFGVSSDTTTFTVSIQ